MPVWEQGLIVIAIVAVLFLWVPGAKKAMQDSRNAENPDWKGALIPIALVILFVILLISMTQG